MTVTTAPDWSEVSGEARIGRRGLLVLSAGAAAALLAGSPSPLFPPAAPSLTAQQFVRSLSKVRWGWSVELAVLQHYPTDRRYALDLLWAALELDLDPTQRRQHKPALRLYDLYAAAAGHSGQTALAHLVTSRSSDPKLLARAALWSASARTRRSNIWRTMGPDRRPIGIVLRAA